MSNKEILSNFEEIKPKYAIAYRNGNIEAVTALNIEFLEVCRTLNFIPKKKADNLKQYGRMQRARSEMMYELKRFTMKSTHGIRSVVKPDGMWCRYSDVERILKQLAKNNPRPMTNEEYLAALAKLQNKVNSFKGQAKADAKTIKKLRQECVRLRNKLNKSEMLRKIMANANKLK